MPDQLDERTVYEETLDNVTVQVHRIEEGYRIVLVSRRMAYFSPPLASLKDCEVEIQAMKDLVEAKQCREAAA